MARKSLLSVSRKRTCNSASSAAAAWSTKSPSSAPDAGAGPSVPALAVVNSRRLANSNSLYRPKSLAFMEDPPQQEKLRPSLPLLCYRKEGAAASVFIQYFCYGLNTWQKSIIGWKLGV